MKTQLELLESVLTPEDARMLRRVYAPQAVAVPAMDTRCAICVMPDGELRSYGFEDKKNHADCGRLVYLSSYDCGLSWKKREGGEALTHGSALRSPYSGRYVSIVGDTSTTGLDGRRILQGQGICAVLSGSPASEEFTVRPITQENVRDMYLPIALTHRKRLVCAAHLRTKEGYWPVSLLSDDDGETWSMRVLESAPCHAVNWPHKGLRWQNPAAEPTIVERNDGTLWMLARTSQDVFYQYASMDGGDTWSTPTPSFFHGTLTSPALLRLSDGRLLCFWCNTQPLPELDHTKQWPPLREGEITGQGGEDVFTNRDANHAAISEDDGRTWKGFREIGLNEIRNASDFRTRGANNDTLDKSVHQFQAVELPFGKVLLSYGQHPASRRMVLFDPAWLYENERHEDFREGLDRLSTQVYVQSVSGNFRGFSGHCAWNRTHGALLVPDPDGNFEEALLLSRIRDPRLFSEVQGAVWNFPAAHSGELALRLRVEGRGLRVSLTDRWFNPIDTTVAYLAHCSVMITADMIPPGVWSDVRLVWEEGTRSVRVLCGDACLFTAPLHGDMPHGLSYAHLQTMAQSEDPTGAIVKKLSMRTL